MRDGPASTVKANWQIDAGSRSAEQNLDDDKPFPHARNVLTQAEIEALLRPRTLGPDAVQPTPAPRHIKPKPTADFDRPAPDPVEKIDPHTHRLGARLALALSSGAGVKAALSISGQAEIARGDLPGLMQGKSSAIACIGPSDSDIRALICLPPLLADAIIAKACGARGSTGRIGDGWSLSAIDCALLEQLLIPFGRAVDKTYSLQAIETDVSYVSSLLPVTDVTVSEFLLEAPGLHSELAVIEGRFTDIETESAGLIEGAHPAGVTAVLTARLASLTVPLSRLTELKAGSTLLLGLPPDQPVELLSGGRDGTPAFEGVMGRKGTKMAVKLTKRQRRF